MRKKLLTAAGMIISVLGFAQQMDLPVTFDEAGIDYGVIGFEGAEASSIEVDPTDNMNTVVKVIKSASAQPWAGTTVTNANGDGFATPIPIDASNTRMTVRVWSPDANIPVLLKIEDHLDPTHSVQTLSTVTTAMGWETLVFDFANEQSGTAALNLSYTFDKVSVFFNYGTDGATAGEKTYYFDDVEFLGGGGISSDYNVTFSVDMNGITGFTTPEVNGTFNSWCGGCAPMTDANSDGIWEVTIAIPSGVHEYKFAYDSWAGQETLTEGSACTVTNSGLTNRSLTVTADAALPTVCWEACTACNVASEFDVTFSVDMNGVSGFTTPEVNGTFNSWCGGCAPMSDGDGDGIWEITIPLAPGTYEYKFAYDSWAGQENLTEGSSCTVTNNGFTNRALTVSADATLGAVCWESCEACGTVAISHDVTFSVDMNGVTGFTTPEVNGTFNNWCGNCAPMTDDNTDGIWEVTISVPEGNHEYKFTYDGFAGQEEFTPGGSCTVTNNGFTNRALTVTAATTLPTVCWASCSACASGGNAIVLFRVDMNNVTDAYTTPEVNGTFNNWCGGCAPMSDDNSDGVWELAIELAPGSYEYKFAYDSWAGQETLLPGGSCVVTNSGFTNRVIEVTVSEDLPVVCWGSCADCNSNEGPFNITFQVDMNQVTEAFTTPEVNGTFNGFCGGCAPMTDANSDGIWEITIPIAADTVEYKFAYDAWAGQEDLTPGSSCTSTIDGFTNRSLIVTENVVLPPVCWASCNLCTVGFEQVSSTEFSVYPNPSSDILNVNLSASTGDLVTVQILDATGRLLVSQQASTSTIQLETQSLSSGVYFVQVSTNTSRSTKPVFVQH